MGGTNSLPTVVKQRRRVSIRSGGSLVNQLLEGKYEQVISKVRSEANKEVCVKLDDDQERWVLPLHIACALPTVPLSVIRSLILAYPQALMHHTTLNKSKKHEPCTDVCSKAESDQASSVASLETNAWGVGWLPLHVAAHYGAPRETIELLLKECPDSIYCKTTEGQLPLHVACNMITTSQHLIEPLINAFPLSIHVSTSDGMSARDLASFHAKGESFPGSGLLEPVSSTSTAQSERQPARPMHNIPVCCKHRSTFKKIISVGRLEAKRETGLFKALATRQWTSAVELLSRKPKHAKVWTLSPDPSDPPCHLLPLHVALRRNAPVKVVQALLNANPSAVYRREYYGMLPLHVSCDLGLDIQVVELLCEAYQDATRQPDLGGMLPLHLACASPKTRRPAVVTYLLSVNPKAMHAKDGQGQEAQEYCGSGDLSKEFDRGEAFWAAKDIQKNKLALLICQKQWDDALERLRNVPEEATAWTVHPIIQLRYLPLHYACIVHAPTDLVEALMEVHPVATSTECQEYNMLPLHLACQHSARPRVVEALLTVHKEAAATTDAFDLLPLHLACTQGACATVIEALVAAHPDAIAAVDSNGYTPKVYAETVIHPHSKKVLSMLEEMIRQP